MPRRLSPIAHLETYHVYNRSVGTEEIFTEKYSLMKIVEAANHYRFRQQLSLSKYSRLNDNDKKNYVQMHINNPPLVEIYSYAFMPNHFHFLLKECVKGGITYFTSNIQNSFASYFNKKFQRHGSLFQNQFKAKRIETDSIFLHVSRYIHLNPVTAYLTTCNRLDTYPWTSFPSYVGSNNSFVTTQPILDFFNKSYTYKEFIADQVGFQRELASIKNFIFE